MMQMKLALMRILKKYRLEVAQDTKIAPDVRIKATLVCAEVNVAFLRETVKCEQKCKQLENSTGTATENCTVVLFRCSMDTSTHTPPTSTSRNDLAAMCGDF